MKNREKYPNTDEALKAFMEHNKVCNCGCSFEEWLDKDAPNPINMAIAGIMVSSLFRSIVGPKGKPADKEDEKPSNVAGFTEVECPICHGNHGVIGGVIVPGFTCPDCGAFVGVTKLNPSALSPDGFKPFIADLCKKNNRKD